MKNFSLLLMLIVCFFPAGFKFLIGVIFSLDLSIRHLSEGNPEGLIIFGVIILVVFAVLSIVELANYCSNKNIVEINLVKNLFGLLGGVLAVFYSVYKSHKVQFVFEGLPILGAILLLALVLYTRQCKRRE